MFNAKPKNGIAFLEKQGLITPSPDDEGTDDEKKQKAIARFLRSSTRLDKKLLGEYISRPDQVELLKAFIGLFDFKGVRVIATKRACGARTNATPRNPSRTP
jgi:brefeldin A-resistance guanine nucleotide exchange factor 1